VKTYSFTIPGDPRGKGRPKATAIGGRARVYTDLKTRSYEGQIANLADFAMNGAEPLSGPVHVNVRVLFKPVSSTSKKAREAMLAMEIMPAKRPDLDNVVKAVLDGMNGIAFKDDAQVCSMTAAKRYAATAGVEVVFWADGERS
jgi:Holliday junction resolvase RusA-like endonuclease